MSHVAFALGFLDNHLEPFGGSGVLHGDQVWRRNTTTLRISSDVMFIWNF